MRAKHTVLLVIVAGLAAAAVVAGRLLRASSSPTFETETASLDGSPPRGTRSIGVDTASAFESALARAEGRDIEGRILETSGVAQGADFSAVSLVYGRPSDKILGNPAFSKVAYAAIERLRLGDILPRL